MLGLKFHKNSEESSVSLEVNGNCYWLSLIAHI